MKMTMMNAAMQLWRMKMTRNQFRDYSIILCGCSGALALCYFCFVTFTGFSIEQLRIVFSAAAAPGLYYAFNMFNEKYG